MTERDDKTFDPSLDTDVSKAQSGQQPATTPDDTSATQTEGFKQPTEGADQQVDTAGETTTLGQQGTDIEGEGEASRDTGFVGSEGEQDTSPELIDQKPTIDKDGQPPLDGE